MLTFHCLITISSTIKRNRFAPGTRHLIHNHQAINEENHIKKQEELPIMSKNKTDQPVTAAVDSCPFQNGKQTMKSKEAVDLELSVKKKRNVYDAPLRKPSLLQRLEQHFQIHIIRHPWGILANTIGFVLVIFQSVQVAGYKPMPQKRELFGQTFCYAGQVVISEWDKVEEILTTKPQKRTFQLGFFPLTPDHLPAMVTEKCWQRRKRNLFVSCCYFFQKYVQVHASLLPGSSSVSNEHHDHPLQHHTCYF